MQSSWGGFIVYSSLSIFIVSTLLLVFIRGKKFWESRQAQQRVQYTALYRPLIDRIMEKVEKGEPPVYHSYHPSHRPLIYSLMLEYARTHSGDYYPAFDYMGFTDDLLSGSLSQNSSQVMEHMAIIRSPMFHDYLYIALLEEDPDTACQAAYAITRLPLTSRDHEIILPSLLNIEVLAGHLHEYVAQMKPSPQLCRELLIEDLSVTSRQVLLEYLASTGGTAADDAPSRS